MGTSKSLEWTCAHIEYIRLYAWGFSLLASILNANKGHQYSLYNTYGWSIVDNNYIQVFIFKIWIIASISSHKWHGIFVIYLSVSSRLIGYNISQKNGKHMIYLALRLMSIFNLLYFTLVYFSCWCSKGQST